MKLSYCVMVNETLVVSCKRANLKRIRTFVDETLAPFGLPEIQLNQLILAVDEVCANFIIHSNHEDDSKTIQLAITGNPNEVQFDVSDSAPAYHPGSYHEPNLKDLIQQGRKGGVGMMLVNRIMDKVEFRSVKGRNVCRLYKRL